MSPDSPVLPGELTLRLGVDRIPTEVSDELIAVAQMCAALETLDDAAQRRVLAWAADRFGGAA